MSTQRQSVFHFYADGDDNVRVECWTSPWTSEQNRGNFFDQGGPPCLAFYGRIAQELFSISISFFLLTCSNDSTSPCAAASAVVLQHCVSLFYGPCVCMCVCVCVRVCVCVCMCVRVCVYVWVRGCGGGMMLRKCITQKIRLHWHTSTTMQQCRT
jgi:hypothetical protein